MNVINRTGSAVLQRTLEKLGLSLYTPEEQVFRKEDPRSVNKPQIGWFSEIKALGRDVGALYGAVHRCG